MSVVENDLHFTHIDAIDIFRKILVIASASPALIRGEIWKGLGF